MKKKIMVDMDGVITGTNFSRIVSDFLGYKPDFENMKTYYLQEALGEKKDDFFDKFKDMDLYENAKLFPNCYEVLKDLSEKYDIYVCTDYIWPEIIEYAGNNLKNKYKFLYEKLDFLNPRNFIFTADKSIINCDIKIDDKVDNLDGAKTKLLFTAWHNKNLSKTELDCKNMTRVDDWLEIRNILLEKVENEE